MNQSHTGTSSQPHFETLPLVSLADEVIRGRLAGLEPGVTVTLRARTIDDLDHVWESTARFTADAGGTIDLSRQAPERGSYEGVEPMGFLWSMRPVDGVSGWSKTTALPVTIDLTAEVSPGVFVEAKVARLVAGPGVTRTEVRDDGLYGTLFTPSGAGSHPTIMLLGGSGGGLSEPQAALYASRGYCALALAYFRAGHLPVDLVEIPLEYFERAIAWLAARPEVDASRLAVGGTSRGGELCLLLASRYPQFKAVVASVPSAIVYGGIGSEEESHTRPAWTYRGEAIPYLHARPGHLPEYDTAGGDGFALTSIYLRSLEQAEAARRATIPVEQINGPVLAISGKEDAMWPSSVYGDMVLERLSEHLHPYPDQHLTYAGTGHSVGQPWWPTTITKTLHPVSKILFALGGDPKQSAHARADTWSQTLAFLEANL